jgi:hypothetical protein
MYLQDGSASEAIGRSMSGTALAPTFAPTNTDASKGSASPFLLFKKSSPGRP